MCVCIYMYIYIYIYMYVCMYVRAYVYVYIYIDIYVYIYIYRDMYIHTTYREQPWLATYVYTYIYIYNISLYIHVCSHSSLFHVLFSWVFFSHYDCLILVGLPGGPLPPRPHAFFQEGRRLSRPLRKKNLDTSRICIRIAGLSPQTVAAAAPVLVAA